MNHHLLEAISETANAMECGGATRHGILPDAEKTTLDMLPPVTSQNWPRNSGERLPRLVSATSCTTNLRTRILDFRGFDSSRILMLRGGILMSRGNFPEILSPQILVRIISAGRLGVPHPMRCRNAPFVATPLHYLDILKCKLC